MITSNDISKLQAGLKVLENFESKENTISSWARLKDTTPFSRALNNYINEWFEVYKNIFIFTEVDDFDENDLEGTLEKHINRFKDTGKIHIWTGGSDRTIFGDPTINHKFRAWHDYTHITLGYGYDFVGESIVASIQVSQLPEKWVFERELVLCEIVGQAQYFMLHNTFIDNQRAFTAEYLARPYVALTTKY